MDAHEVGWDDDTLVIGVTVEGALFGNAMTWWDHATGSVWSQPTGEAILGPLAGTRLDLLASTLTSWGVWRVTYPGTTALDEPGGPSGFDVDDTLVAVELGGESLAVAVTAVGGLLATAGRPRRRPRVGGRRVGAVPAAGPPNGAWPATAGSAWTHWVP